MFQVFHLNVAYISQWLHTCFSGVSDVRCKCFSCFRRMVQVFHLDVANLDLSVAHVAIGLSCRHACAWEAK
jgi:hypothetical protein